MDASEIRPLLEGIELTKIVGRSHRWQDIVFVPCEYALIRKTPHVRYWVMDDLKTYWVFGRLKHLFQCELSQDQYWLVSQKFLAVVLDGFRIDQIVPFLCRYSPRTLRLAMPQNSNHKRVSRAFLNLLNFAPDILDDFFLLRQICPDNMYVHIERYQFLNHQYRYECTIDYDLALESQPHLEANDDYASDMDLLEVFLGEYFCVDHELDVDNIMGKTAGHWV